MSIFQANYDSDINDGNQNVKIQEFDIIEHSVKKDLTSEKQSEKRLITVIEKKNGII